MLLVELREPAIWVRRLSSGELEVELEGLEAFWVLRSCWTLATADLESVVLPEARSLRRVARSLVSWEVVELLEGSVLVFGEVVAEVDEVPVRSARRVFSIRASAEDEMDESDMREIPSSGLELPGHNTHFGILGGNFSGRVEETESGTVPV